MTSKLILISSLLLSSNALLAADDQKETWKPRQAMMGMRGGMMGMDGGMCPMGFDGKVNVINTKDGVTINVTSDDKKEIQKIQKRAAVMKLMQELHEIE